MNNIPLVSIQCLVYNHEPYLRQCLEGFLLQQTTFRFEVIIHDDVSIDNSVAIIREYAENYPNIIIPIYEKENQYSRHDGTLERIMYEACRGKYIAMCEGDDYWIDPLKLQMQVDFLEAHPECVYSCHRYNLYDEISKQEILFPNLFFDREKSELNFIFDIEYPFLHDWVTKTLTCMYRKEALDISNVEKYKYYRDTHIVYSILLNGKGVCHSFVGGVYRMNPNSTFGSQSNLRKAQISYEVNAELYTVTHSSIFYKAAKKSYVELLLLKRKLQIPQSKLEINTVLFYVPFLILRKGYKCFLKLLRLG